MANAVQIIFQIDQDQQGRNVLRQIDQGINKIGQTSKNVGGGIESAFSFLKGALIVEAFRRGADAAFAFGKAAVDAFNSAQAAALGLQSVAKFKGIDAQSASETVKNLDLVKSGLLSIGDASTTLKNLLQTGFSLEQSVQLLNRFGDSAAFGRQQALSFGQAIVSTSEGIRNQNSILSDNGGITKNLSVILKERGFELQDLSDKVKGASAREALYQGLLVETQAQVGDAAKLTTTYAGGMAKLEAEQQKLLVTLGEIITKNPDLNESFRALGESIGIINSILKDSESELSRFVKALTFGFANVVRGAAELLKDLEGILFLLRKLNAGGVLFPAIQNVGKRFGFDVFGQDEKIAQEKALEEAKRLQGELSDFFNKRGSQNLAGQFKPIRDKKDQKALEKLVKDGLKEFEQIQKNIREAGDAVADLGARIGTTNPLANLFTDAATRQREFLERFKEIPEEIKSAFERANNDVLRLELFKGTLAQGLNLNNLLAERARLEAGGDESKFAQLQKENIDRQLATVRDFLGRATNDAQRQFANEQILQLTSGGNLTSEQRDIRRQALDSQIVVAQKAFTENFNRLNEQTNATKENSFALVQVGNSLASVEGALTNFARAPIKIEIQDETRPGTVAIDYGTINPEIN